MDRLAPGEINGLRPIARDEDLVVILEDDAQRLPRPFFVINDQERQFLGCVTLGCGGARRRIQVRE